MRRGAGPRGRVAAVLLAAEQAGEVLEERELLTHEDAVGLVLAADLGEHAAQLRAALACGDRVGRAG